MSEFTPLWTCCCSQQVYCCAFDQILMTSTIASASFNHVLSNGNQVTSLSSPFTPGPIVMNQAWLSTPRTVQRRPSYPQSLYCRYASSYAMTGAISSGYLSIRPPGSFSSYSVTFNSILVYAEPFRFNPPDQLPRWWEAGYIINGSYVVPPSSVGVGISVIFSRIARIPLDGCPVNLSYVEGDINAPDTQYRGLVRTGAIAGISSNASIPYAGSFSGEAIQDSFEFSIT